MDSTRAPRPSRNLTVDVVTDGRSSGGAYALLDVRAAADTVLPPHAPSREDGTLIVLEGRVELVLARERSVLGPGDQAFLRRSLPRRLCVLTDARLLWLVVPAGIERLLAVLDPPGADPDDVAALLAGAGVALLPSRWCDPAAR